MDKQLVEAVVFGFDLVVELNHIEVDHVSYFVVDCLVTSVFVVLVLEIGSLRGMSYYMVGKLSSESSRELNQPGLSVSSLHGLIVLPIDISTIEIVFLDELAKFLGTHMSI